jgi:hypothetical protein
MDFSNKYNTTLSAEEEKQFTAWAQDLSKALGRDVLSDTVDYDLRGAFTKGVAPSENMHFPDTFKKPNHPTFSQESIYSGVDGYIGGAWEQDQAGKWKYFASPTNVYDEEALKKYFKEREKDSELITNYMLKSK